MGDGTAKEGAGAWDALVVNHRLLELAVRELEHRLRPEPGRQKGLREKLSVHRLLLRLRLPLPLQRLLLLHHVFAPLCAQQSARGEPKNASPRLPPARKRTHSLPVLKYAEGTKSENHNFKSAVQ